MGWRGLGGLYIRVNCYYFQRCRDRAFLVRCASMMMNAANPTATKIRMVIKICIGDICWTVTRAGLLKKLQHLGENQPGGGGIDARKEAFEIDFQPPTSLWLQQLIPQWRIFADPNKPIFDVQ